MGKRFWICCIVVSVAAMVLGLIVHGLLLRGDYVAHAGLYRSQAEASARAPWLLAASISPPSFSSSFLTQARPIPEPSISLPCARWKGRNMMSSLMDGMPRPLSFTEILT